MKRINRTVFALVFLQVLACWFTPAVFGFGNSQSDTSKTIHRIQIFRKDVFVPIPGNPAFLYRWANDLHAVTRETVIRRDLLFKAGDKYDPELLAESERILRRLPYLGSANITLANRSKDSVDVQVVTQDQWSTLLSYIFTKNPGRTIYGGALEEFNFLGRGKRLFGEIRHEVGEGTRFTFRHTDPQLFGSRWTTRETLIRGPFLKNISARVVRPFYALDTKWAWGTSASVNDETIRLFSESLETSRVKLQSQRLTIFAARAYGSRFRKKRLQLSYTFRNRNFSALGERTTSPVPDDELIHSLTLGLTRESILFKKETRLDKFQRVEDLTLGRITSLSFGRTGLPVPSGVKRFEAAFRHREAHEILSDQYVFAVISFRTLFEKDTITSLRFQYYNKRLWRQTLAFNMAFDHGKGLEATRQFLLGGDSGLRGFPSRQFSGNKRFLINMEDRFFSDVNFLTVALGGVVFVDAGNVWPTGQNINFNDLNYSIGAGFRLGYTKSPDSRVGRIDFAWALNGGGFAVSIGVDQVFSIN